MSLAGHMKRAATFPFVVLVLGLSGLSAAQDIEGIPITKHEISKDVVVYQVGRTGVFSNMTAVRTSAGTVVFDSLMSPALARRVRDMIEKDFGPKIACLINTHGAYDHTTGNSAFKDVPIYGHANIKAEMERFGQMVGSPGAKPPSLSPEELKKRIEQARELRAKQLEEVKKNYLGDPREFEESDQVRGFLGPANRPEMVVPTTLIGDSYVLTVGDKTFRISHNTPSYSESDIITYIPEIRTLIVGDIFNAHRLPLVSSKGTDLEAWNKLFSPYLGGGSKVDHFIGTHGAGVLTGAEITEQLQYLKKLFEEVKTLKASGKTSAEIQSLLPLDKFPYLSTYNPYFYGTAQSIHGMNINFLWNQMK